MPNVKPFIKLLHSPNAFYFYDVNKNDIIEIDEQEYQFLNSFSDASTNSFEGYQHLEQLHANGYLQPMQVEKIYHPLTDYSEDLLQRSLQKITLQLTQNCNFRCTYCTYTQANESQRHHSNAVMSFDVAKKAIDYLFEHSVDSSYVYIGFYGGEPLLEFELLKKIVSYSNQKFLKGEIKYTITTNASVLTNEILTFLKEQNISIVISLDGSQKIHDSNRVFANSNNKGTFSTVISKLKMFFDSEYEYFKKLTINMVVDESHDFNEVLSVFEEYPFLKQCNIQINFIDDFYSDEKNNVADSFVTSMEYQKFLGYLCLLNRVPSDKLSLAVISRVSEVQNSASKFMPKASVNYIDAPGGPCLPGKNRLLVTYDGRFIPCERVSETSKEMYLGDIDLGIDFNRANKMLNVAQITTDECMKCWAFAHCTSCVKLSDDNGELSASKRLAHCDNIRRSVLHNLYEQIMIKECQN